MSIPSDSVSVSSRVMRSCCAATQTFCGQLLKSSTFISLLLFLLGLCTFTLLTPQALPNGDAALYAQQITGLDFTRRTVHWGYYLIGTPFVHLLPFSPDHALNLMNCFYGALCVSLLFIIALEITSNLTVSLIAALALLTRSTFVGNAVFAEIYVSQLFFFLLAIALLLRRRPLAAGFSYGLSFLITPSALFGLSMLIPFRRNRGMLLRFLAAFLPPVLMVVSLHSSDYFSGGRGMLKTAHTVMSLDEALIKEYREYFVSMLWLMPFMLAGLVELFRDRRYRPWGAAILVMWMVSLLAGERFGDVPVQLPAYAFFCITIGLGVHLLAGVGGQKSRIIAVALYLYLIINLSAAALLTDRQMRQQAAHLTQYRDTVLSLRQVARPGFLVIGGWTQGILCEHYLTQQSYTGMWINTEWLGGTWGMEMYRKSSEKLSLALGTGREIWLLNHDTLLFSRLKQQGYSITPYRSIFRALPGSGGRT